MKNPFKYFILISIILILIGVSIFFFYPLNLSKRFHMDLSNYKEPEMIIVKTNYLELSQNFSSYKPEKFTTTDAKYISELINVLSRKKVIPAFKKPNRPMLYTNYKYDVYIRDISTGDSFYIVNLDKKYVSLYGNKVRRFKFESENVNLEFIDDLIYQIKSLQ